MPFVLTRFIEHITIDKEFAESLASELRSNHISEGVILMVAKKIELESSYTFSYNNTSEVNIPGQYNLIIVADQLQSKEAQIGRIDLTGGTGRHPAKQKTGENGDNAGKDEAGEAKFAIDGGEGTIGDSGGRGKTGNNIKLFCNQLGRIEVFANGGLGGKGGTGGDGGKGGNGANVIIEHHNQRLPPASGGDGANGGIGGDGGNAGSIQGFFCKADNGIVFQSVGGLPGDPGEGGEAGKGGTLQNQHAPDGHPGGKPTITGIRGSDSTISVNQVEFSELWEKVVIELNIPSG
jgi:hypothetical protein